LEGSLVPSGLKSLRVSPNVAGRGMSGLPYWTGPLINRGEWMDETALSRYTSSIRGHASVVFRK